MMKMNKFYVGCSSFASGGPNSWAHATVEGATKHAINRCEATGDQQIVVEIIRIVKRQPPTPPLVSVSVV